MKFVIDQQLPPALVEWFSEKGHSAEHVFHLGLGEADDAVIWEWAVNEGAAVVTKDADFAERRQLEASGPIILWLKTGNTTTAILFAILDRAWPDIEAALANVAVIEVR